MNNKAIKKYKIIIILMIISFITQSIFQGFEIETVYSIIFQLVASWIISFIYYNFYRKYKKANFSKVWGYVYLVLILMYLLNEGVKVLSNILEK